MKTVIIYKSKYGTTEKYANWIAEATNSDIFNVDSVKTEDLKSYDTIVYCGGLYAGGILGFSFIKNNYNYLSDKKLIVVAVGATLKKQDGIKEISEKNLTEEMRDEVQLFILRGGLNYKKMNLLDRFLMFIMVSMLKMKKKETLDDDSKGVIATYGKVVDFTNIDTILPVVDAVKAKRL
jgi:menaquinone-dependent protoporphyrinogen IX oxidase